MAGSATLNVAVLVNAAQAAAGLQQVGNKAETVGSKMKKAFAGLALGAGIAAFAKQSIESLARIERINAQTAQTIKSTGGAAGVSAEHVEDLAGSLENLTATEAETTQQGANLLLTFTNIKNAAGAGNDVFDQATTTLVDMSRALGTDATTSAIQLGKALNDPIKGVSALQKVGVSFTADQKAMIASLVEAGDVMGAQKIILAELNKEFGGSGAAYAATAAGQWDLFVHALGTFGESVMTEVMPALSSLATIGGEAFNWLAELPGPIKAITLGILGLVTVSALFGTKAAAGFSAMMTSITSATAGTAGLKSALAGIGKALAGGALVFGAAAILGAIAIEINRITDAAKKGETALTTYVSELVKSGGKSTEATAEAFRTAVKTSDAFAELVKDGFTAQEAVDILSGTIENWHAVMGGSLGTVHNLNRDTMNLVNGFIDANGAAGGLAQAQLDADAAMGGTTAATQEQTAALAEQQAAAELSEEAIKDLETSLKDLQDAQTAAFDATDASHLLGELDLAEQKADRAGKVIKAALEDAFPERGRLRATGLSDLVGQVAELGAKIKQEDIGGQIRDIFVDIENMDPIKLAALGDPGAQVQAWAGSFQTSWDAALTETFRNTGGNVEQTVADMLGHTKNLTDQVAAQLGIPFEEAEQVVAASIGNIDAQTLKDKVLQITADDQEAYEKVLFYDSIRFDPVTKTFVSDIKIPPVEQIVAEMNAKFDLVPPGVVGVNPELTPQAGTIMEQLIAGLPDVAGPTVTPSVDPKPVQKDLATIAGTTTSTTVDIKGNPKPATSTIAGDVVNPKRETYPVSVIANSAPARNAIEAFRRDYAALTIVATLNANTAPARFAMEAFRGDYSGMNVTATILGNSAPARQAIDAVENGSYSATVRIIADTSAFFSAFNALPGAKPVTAAAAAAPRVAVSGFAAPSLARSSSARAAPMTTSAGGGLTINVSGALWPDEAARAVESVLRRRDRRTGAIRI